MHELATVSSNNVKTNHPVARRYFLTLKVWHRCRAVPRYFDFDNIRPGSIQRHIIQWLMIGGRHSLVRRGCFALQTSEWSLPNTVPLRSTVLLTGFPSSATDDEIKDSLPPSLTHSLSKVTGGPANLVLKLYYDFDWSILEIFCPLCQLVRFVRQANLS